MNKPVIFGVVLIVLAVIMSGAANWFKSQPAEVLEPKSNFEVVARYQNRCDIVRWHNNMLAEYKYFLDCSNK